jgi:bacterial/archaeal transporter family-2 protein
MRYLLSLLALAMGLAIPIQAAVNSALKIDLDESTLLAAFVSFAVGTATLFLLCLATRQPVHALSVLPYLPWWELIGGLLGSFFVFSTIILAPRIGIAAMISCVVAGQIATSLALDRIGFLGLPVREISTAKLCGAALLVAGVILVNFADQWFPN